MVFNQLKYVPFKVMVSDDNLHHYIEALFELMFKSMYRVFDIHDTAKLVDLWQVKIRMNDVTSLR